jgi:hypothetical protein
MVNKHTVYFELRDAIEDSGCPICRLSRRSVIRYLESLSYESVNDFGLRARLRHSRGFCNLHAWQLLDEVRDPFGSGIIYRDVLNEVVRLLAQTPNAMLDAATLAPVGDCLACQARAESTQRYLGTLLDHLGDADLESHFVRAGGLCWPHFRVGVTHGGQYLPRLAELQRAALVDESAHVAVASTSPRRSSAKKRLPDQKEPATPAWPLFGGRGIHGPLIGQNGWWQDQATAVGASAPEESIASDGSSRPDSQEASAHDCPICQAGLGAVESALAHHQSIDSRPGRQGAMNRAPTDGTIPDREKGDFDLCLAHGTLLPADGATGALLDEGRRRATRLIGEAESEFVRLRTTLVILGRAIERPAAKRERQELSEGLSLGEGCRVCAAQARAERESLATMEEDMVVCLPHLRALGHLRGGISGNARGRQLERWRPLVADLEEYIRKNDYRFRSEPRGDEQTSPWRAIGQVAGERGVR